MLKIDKNYRLTGKDLNFVLEYSHEIKEHFNVSSDKIGTSRWQTAGYFSAFTSVKSYLVNKNNISEENMIAFNSIVDKFNSAIESFKDIVLHKENNVKIIVNNKWYIVGSRMFFRIVKKEQIQKHRFTKEENIGKDKFINMGSVPNIVIALKSIMNEEILELLSSDNEIKYADIEYIIDKLVSDSKSLLIEDATSDDQLKIDEQDYEDNEDTNLSEE